MYLKINIIFILLVNLILISCKKTVDLVPAASLNVVNVSPGIANAKVKTPNVDPLYFSQLAGVNYSNNQVFTIPTGSSPIAIYSSTDTLGKSLYSSSITTKAGGISSLFLGGYSGTDAVLVKDIIPYHADSSFGVRFINMNSTSTQVNVILSTSIGTDEFSNISYKSITDFKNYAATAADPSIYTFQVLDGSGNILASTSVSPSNYLQHNVTLVFDGMIDSTGITAPGIFVVNNY